MAKEKQKKEMGRETYTLIVLLIYSGILLLLEPILNATGIDFSQVDVLKFADGFDFYRMFIVALYVVLALMIIISLFIGGKLKIVRSK